MCLWISVLFFCFSSRPGHIAVCLLVCVCACSGRWHTRASGAKKCEKYEKKKKEIAWTEQCRANGPPPPISYRQKFINHDLGIGWVWTKKRKEQAVDQYPSCVVVCGRTVCHAMETKKENHLLSKAIALVACQDRTATDKGTADRAAGLRIVQTDTLRRDANVKRPCCSRRVWESPTSRGRGGPTPTRRRR